jgi:hypothetical protein
VLDVPARDAGRLLLQVSRDLPELRRGARRGVFTRAATGGPAVFHEGRAPSTIDVAAIAGRVDKRLRRWLRRRELLDERPAEDRSSEAPMLSPMEACMQASWLAGEFAHVPEGGPQPEEHEADEARFRMQKKSPWRRWAGSKCTRG